MSLPPEIQFISRQCKTGEHLKCDGQWSGFGVQIVCTCNCGHSEKGPALERISGFHSNAAVSVEDTPVGADAIRHE